jgi:hypothetical protein
VMDLEPYRPASRLFTEHVLPPTTLSSSAAAAAAGTVPAPSLLATFEMSFQLQIVPAPGTFGPVRGGNEQVKPFTLCLKTTSSCEELFVAVHKRTGIPALEIRLAFGDRQLHPT